MRTSAALALRLLFVCAIVVTQLTIPVEQSPALTSTTITIDGDFGDWIGVRTDTDNVAFDTQVPDDPDWPGQADRDIFYVNSTFDSEYLYFCWRRTAGGNKAITFGAYLDLGGDGLLNEGRDVVVAWTMADPVTTAPSQQNYDETGRILHYYQARTSGGALVHPAGDPMDHYGPPPVTMQNPPPANWTSYLHATPHGDGNTPDGWAIGSPSWGESYPSKPMDGYLDHISGIEAEARVAWSDLGFGPGEIPPRIAIHFATGNGEDFGTANKTSLWPSDYRVVSGKLQESNRGQVEDNVKGIYWLSTKGVTVTPDNSQGTLPGTTVTYAHTVTNHSNITDTLDLTALSSRGWVTGITDSGGAPITSLTIPARGSRTVYVKVTVPAGATNGTTDITTLTARSQDDPSVSGSATDTTRVGAITVTPDQAATMAPGQTAEYSFTVQNNLMATHTLDLSTLSTLGFPNTIVNAAGTPISSVSLAPGQATTVRVRVAVPLSATIGMQDVMTLTAAVSTAPTVKSSAKASTTVRLGLDIEKNETGYGGANSWVQYTHTITNSWPSTRTINVSALSSRGWPVRIFAEDGITEITSLTLGPNGATRNIIVRIQVPSGVTVGTEDYTTVTATTGGVSDSVVDHTTVRRLTTFADAGYVNEDRDFYLTEQVYARATGLDPSLDVYFVWKNANGQIVRTSATRRVDTQGMAFDEYPSTISDPIGPWMVELRDAKNGTLLESSPFTMSWKAVISALAATDAPSIGTSVTVSSQVQNQIGNPLSATSVKYVVWWDSNANGTFDAGDIYINPTGAPVTWDGTSPVTVTHTTTGVNVAANSSVTLPNWDISNAQFPNQGTYRVTATWYHSDGVRVIDQKTTEFYSIPTLGWPLFALSAGLLAFLMVRRARKNGMDFGGAVA